VHRASVRAVVLADDRRVVLGLAGGDARAATGAAGEVDAHHPLVTRGVVVLAVQLHVFDLVGQEAVDEVVICLVLRARATKHDRAVLHRERLLRSHEGIGPPPVRGARSLDVDVRDHAPGGHAGREQRRRVEAAIIADRPRRGTPLSERDGHHAGGDAAHCQNRGVHDAIVDTQRDPVLVLHLERLGRARGHDCGVVPDELGDRLGQFLQPPVRGEAPVVRRVVGEQHELVRAALAERLAGQILRGIAAQRGRRLRGQRSVEAAAQHPLPGGLAAVAEDLVLPTPAQESVPVIGGQRRIVGSQRLRPPEERFGLLARVEQGPDHRLAHAAQTRAGGGVAPRLQVVVAGQREVRGAEGLVEPQSVPDAELRATHEGRAVAGEVVDGIHAQADEDVRIGREGGGDPRRIARDQARGCGVPLQGRSRRAELVVQETDRRVHGGRQVRAAHDQGAAPVRSEVGDQGVKERAVQALGLCELLQRRVVAPQGRPQGADQSRYG